MSEKVIRYLIENVGLLERKSLSGGHADRTEYRFVGGGVWEVDDFRKVGHRNASLDNKYCESCKKSSDCVEGPYAIRIGPDLTAYTCLARRDNGINFLERGLRDV